MLVGRLAPATVTVVAFDRPKLMITLATTCEQGKIQGKHRYRLWRGNQRSPFDS